MYYKGSINDTKFIDELNKNTRGYLCGAFEKAPIYSEKIEIAFMNSDELKRHINKKHHHEIIDDFCMVVKGSMEQEVDNVLLKLKEGDFVFIKAKSITRIRSVEDGTLLMVVKGPSIPCDKTYD